MPAEDFRAAYLRDIARTFRQYRALGERAIAQIQDADLHALVGPDANSIAIIARHVAGNLRSRFTDFLTSDGEKPSRDRDAEFEVAQASREEIMASWTDAWEIAMASIDGLAPSDLDRTVTIRGEAFVVVEALNRLAAHAAYHVGQIVFLAKHFAGPNWKSLSIPKGQSAHAKGTYKQGISDPRI